MLKELTDSHHSVYDVLPTLFSYDDVRIALGSYWKPSFQRISLQMCSLSPYRAYNMLNTKYEEGDGLDDGEASPVVIWSF